MANNRRKSSYKNTSASMSSNAKGKKYKFVYTGKDQYMKYFSQCDADDWDFDAFKVYFDTNKRNKINEDSLLAIYKRSIGQILLRKTLPDTIRSQLEEFRSKTDIRGKAESSKKPSPSSTYNISYNMGKNSNPTIIQNNTFKVKTINLEKANKDYDDEDDEDDEDADDEDAGDEDSSKEGSQDGFSSGDYNSQATTRSYIVLHDNNNTKRDDKIKEKEKWYFQGADLTSYLIDYRKTSLYMNQVRSDIELSPSRLLSLSYIYLFPLKPNDSCFKNTPRTLLDDIYNSLKHKNIMSTIPNKISTFADEMLEAYVTNDESVIAVKSGQVLIEAGSAEADKEILIKAANTIIDVSKQINRYNQGSNVSSSTSEDTYVQHFLSPWINNIFYGASYGVKWANAQLAAFTGSGDTNGDERKLYPDFTMYTMIDKFRFDLFVIEVKPPGQTRCLTDQRKVGYELQKMIDKLVDVNITSPVVCGAWVDGKKCSTYKMDLEYNGVYRLIELDSFQIPTTVEDITKAKYIFSIFIKLKLICDETAQKIELTIKERKVKGKNEAQEYAPKRKWKRQAEYEHIKLKKTPKHS